MDKNEDEGFTLIELMVVLLIIAILLAIAIPTFLGARNTANARSTQENLRNALTAEQSAWTQSQSFQASVSNYESALTYTTGTISTQGGNTVGVALYSYASTPTTCTTSCDSVELYGYAKDGNCYAIFQSNNASASYTAYAEYAASGSTKNCAVNTPSGTAPTAGTSAATNTTSGSWNASF